MVKTVQTRPAQMASNQGQIPSPSSVLRLSMGQTTHLVAIILSFQALTHTQSLLFANHQQLLLLSKSLLPCTNKSSLMKGNQRTPSCMHPTISCLACLKHHDPLCLLSTAPNQPTPVTAACASPPLAAFAAFAWRDSVRDPRAGAKDVSGRAPDLAVLVLKSTREAPDEPEPPVEDAVKSSVAELII